MTSDLRHLNSAQEGQAVTSLPFNAQYIQMEQLCAWGMLNALFATDMVDVKTFGSIIVTTSFVRGPYVPPGFQVQISG